MAGNLAATGLEAAAMELEKLVKDSRKKPPQANELKFKFSDLEKALNLALESAGTLGAPAQAIRENPSAEALTDIPSELSQDIARRIRHASEIGDVTNLNVIAEEIKDRSDSCLLLSKQIVQMAEDFDLDVIRKLADALDSG